MQMNLIKRIKEFKEGDPIPATAQLIKRERRLVSWDWANCDCPALLNCNCRVEKWETVYIYEVYENK